MWRRLLRHTHKINSGTTETLSHNSYDPLGQLITKKVGKSESTPLQTVDYKYNIRGWLTDINDVDDLDNDLFAFKINYNTVHNTIGGIVKPQYNGNISEIFWSTLTDNTTRKYGFAYDDLNRLRDAWYQKPSHYGQNVLNNYNEHLSYDKNGNLLHLWRTGDLDNATEYIIIDNLFYTYDQGNILKKVIDFSNHPDGFTDGANNENEYAYDDFGNLVQDLNKGIYKSGNKGITYNHLNLPKEITFQNNPNKKITYLYNALGQKLEKKVTNGSTIITTDYQGGFQYEDEVLRFFATSEGYVSYDEQSEAFTYIYNYTDHLGNIRLSYKAGAREEDPPAIVDENHYYPFGLKHTNYGFVPQQELAYAKKFNHREWQDEFNLNLTAMDFRQYDNALGRFYNPDRLAELTPGITPYRFAFNNPNYWNDPTGLFESRSAAIAYMNTYGLIGANIIDAGTHWVIESGEFAIYQSGNNIRANYLDGETIMSIVIGSGGGGGSGGDSSGGFGFGGNGGFGGGGGSGGGGYGVNLTYAGNTATIGSFFTTALSDRAAYNATKVYTYGTKTVSAAQLTAQNAQQMGNLSKAAGSISTKIGVAGIGLTIYDDYRNDNLGAGTVAKTVITTLSVAFPAFGLVYGFVDVITLATTGTSLTTHIGNAVDSTFK